MRIAISLVFTALATLAACGGDDGPGSGPVNAADAEAGCRRDCEHDFACDPTGEPVAECTADCAAGVTGWVRADVFEAIIDCMSELACGASDDACIAECQPTSTHDAYEAQCREVFATCGTPEQVDEVCEVTPAPDGEAGFYCIVASPIIEEMTDCIPDGTACEAGITCIQAVFEAHGIN